MRFRLYREGQEHCWAGAAAGAGRGNGADGGCHVCADGMAGITCEGGGR